MTYALFVIFFLAVSAVFATTEQRQPRGYVTHAFIRVVALPWKGIARVSRLKERHAEWLNSENRHVHKAASILANLFG